MKVISHIFRGFITFLFFLVALLSYDIHFILFSGKGRRREGREGRKEGRKEGFSSMGISLFMSFHKVFAFFFLRPQTATGWVGTTVYLYSDTMWDGTLFLDFFGSDHIGMGGWMDGLID